MKRQKFTHSNAKLQSHQVTPSGVRSEVANDKVREVCLGQVALWRSQWSRRLSGHRQSRAEVAVVLLHLVALHKCLDMRMSMFSVNWCLKVALAIALAAWWHPRSSHSASSGSSVLGSCSQGMPSWSSTVVAGEHHQHCQTEQNYRSITESN